MRRKHRMLLNTGWQICLQVCERSTQREHLRLPGSLPAPLVSAGFCGFLRKKKCKGKGQRVTARWQKEIREKFIFRWKDAYAINAPDCLPTTCRTPVQHRAVSRWAGWAEMWRTRKATAKYKHSQDGLFQRREPCPRRCECQFLTSSHHNKGKWPFVITGSSVYFFIPSPRRAKGK